MTSDDLKTSKATARGIKHIPAKRSHLVVLRAIALPEFYLII
ncbi:hypothetical protein [Nostoc sp. C057]|nr:hypothetical protein [Nostoc sp. C057]